METTFEKRVAMMRKIGFRETRTGMTDDRYSFLWYHIDTDEMTDEQFTKYFIEISETKINAAKNYLESQGYCVRNLWHVNDVEGDMTDSEKMGIVNDALADNTQEIFMSIESITNSY
jgi:phosphopantetheine adenylyltransferase